MLSMTFQILWFKMGSLALHCGSTFCNHLQFFGEASHKCKKCIVEIRKLVSTNIHPHNHSSEDFFSSISPTAIACPFGKKIMFQKYCSQVCDLSLMAHREFKIQHSKLWRLVAVVAYWADEQWKQQQRCQWRLCDWLRWQHSPGYRYQSRIRHFACVACCSLGNQKQYKSMKTKQPAKQEEMKIWDWSNDLDQSSGWYVLSPYSLPVTLVQLATTSRIRHFKIIMSYKSFAGNSECLIMVRKLSLPDFRWWLVEHFSIALARNKVQWPQRFGNDD